MFAVYTQDLYQTPPLTLPIESAATYISPYFDGGFWTGMAPPINIIEFAGWPYSAVIDMETSEVLAMNMGEMILSIGQILTAVQQANSD